MRFADFKPMAISDLWTACNSSFPEDPYIDEIAGSVVDGLYRRFGESLAMVRAFLTVPYRSLPKRHDRFARDLARSVGLADALTSHTPVLTLLDTRGRLDEWNDPRRSAGHVAIPLLSESFVASIPMICYLLKELGLPLTWVQDPGDVANRNAIGSEVGYCLVSDASSATDDLGRNIIPAQQFVKDHAIPKFRD
ncbi:MAG: hypothetical protein IT350_07350 [Deltaproteobacteria bacterium]|nr:hypothetical protein [Deltaproteobacteria bacterium]